MLNLKKAARVARFEIAEALHSKGLLLLGLLYGGGAALGSRIFLGILRSAEDSVRATLAENLHVPVSELPQDLVREKAMPWLLGWVQDDATREQLLQMDPLSIFFGFATLQTVALLVLLSSTSTIVRDVSSGAARFVLFRCDRLSWTLGKFAGQALLLGAGLSLAALATGAMGSWVDQDVELSRFGWLLRAAFCSWLYGLAYLGLFLGVSMTVRTATQARALAVVSWFGVAIGHSLVNAESFTAQVPAIKVLAWLFPPHHQGALWSGNWGTFIGACLMLLGFAALSFSAGYTVFERRDA